MSQLEISPDCILEKSANTIVKELLKGSYVIVADLTPELLLQNVLHWNRRKKAFEVFTLFGDDGSKQYNMRFENAIYFGSEIRKNLLMIISGSLPECDLFLIDKYNSLNTKVIYSKHGNHTYKNVQ
ncbi:MAG: hypothetical protein IJE43_01825 [Alphaproteobacteria bacterium]|nr:hypothetical protein [Alphaproteobacteria bacterium]MBQ3512521.1 hypothetical protein [Lachnospiraceae bacterium]